MFAQHSVLDYHVYGLQVCMDVMWTDFFCMDFMCINQLCLKFLCTTFKCINLTECFQAPFVVTYPTMHLQDLNNIWTSYSCQKGYLFTDIHHLKTIVIRVYSTPVSTITLVLVYSVITGASEDQSRPGAQFQTNSDPLVQIRTMSGIPDLFGPTGSFD